MSIRTRLLLANVGVLVVAFLGLFAVTGSQITSGLQLDFEQRLMSQIQLIAQAVQPTVSLFARDSADETALNQAFTPYEAQTGGRLNLFFTGRESYIGENAKRHLLKEEEPPELESAMLRQLAVSTRFDDETGERRLFVASSVLESGLPVALLQFSVPYSQLQNMITERWVSLILGMLGLLGGLVAVIIFTTYRLTRSLGQLQLSAIRLSKGELSHRFASPPQDEVGDVARAFNQMAERIQTMLETQQTFASNTSHEFRTPLASIQLRVEALRRYAGLDVQSRQYVEEIASEINRLTHLIQGLTLLVRLDSDRLELGRDEVDIVRFASALRQQFLEEMAQKNITFSLDLPKEAIVIPVNLAHLNVVFRNLIENALKYTPEGGSITWRMTAMEDGMCHVIRDSGMGISKAHLPHLFQRFYRTDGARTQKIAGSGLGLSIVWAIMKAYSGWVRVESEGEGYGTTVTLFFPFARANEPSQ